MANPRILVVDDEPQLLTLISRVLEARGYEVVSLSSPVQALEFVEATQPPFDLVLSDVTMPGIRGSELVHRILGFWPQVGVVLMSGYFDGEMLPPHVGFLAKPFSLAELIAVVERVLASRNGGSDLRSAHSAGT